MGDPEAEAAAASSGWAAAAAAAAAEIADLRHQLALAVSIIRSLERDLHDNIQALRQEARAGAAWRQRAETLMERVPRARTPVPEHDAAVG